MIRAVTRLFDTSSAPSPHAASEKALRKLRIKYRKQKDGTLVVDGDIYLSQKGIDRLPDLSAVVVKGNFSCANNNLVTLEGAPKYVGGYFSCDGNMLETLKGAPQFVDGSFSARRNKLTSLESAPVFVGGDFSCRSNDITTLEGAPAYVGGDFMCHANKLQSLQHAPQQFRRMISDFGEFDSWKDVPGALRRPPLPQRLPQKYTRGFRM